MKSGFIWLVASLALINLALTKIVTYGKSIEQAKLEASGTSPFYLKNVEVHHDRTTAEHLEDFWQYVPDAKTHRLIILSGMSQMFVIAKYQPGEQNIVDWLDSDVRQFGARAFGLFAPNLNNEEALLLLLSTLDNPKTKPAIFIYGLCFDKFRNIDLRPALLRYLKSRPLLAKKYATIAESYSASYPLAVEKLNASLRAMNEETVTTEKSFEFSLRARLGRVIPAIRDREILNGFAQYYLYSLRNAVLRIKSSSKRPIIPGRYLLNQQFLEILSDVARHEGVTLGFYIIPLNPASDNPYVKSEYETFKHWVADLALERGIAFVNFESLVPSNEWGEQEGGEPDYKHFLGPAHRRTAEAIAKYFQPLIRGRDTAASPPP